MFRGELLKLSTTAATKVALAVGIVGLIGTQLVLVIFLPALASGAIGPGPDAFEGDIPAFDLATASAQLAALSPLGASEGGGSLGLASLAVLVLGVLAGTTDYRFGGIVPTALAEPRRSRILAAKALAMGVTGLVLGVVYALVSLVALLISVAATGATLSVGALDIAAVMGQGVVVVALLALVGLGIGVLARNQLAGVLTMLGVVVAELIVQALAALVSGAQPVWAQLLPLALSQAAIGATPAALPPLAALAGLVGWTVLILGAATFAIRRRDL
jgi:hypothetical protein